MHVVILGAGPAGLGAAYQLRRLRSAEVTVLEQQDRVGGNAGSFDLAGLRVDYGSHRLHPACDPEILQDLRDLLGADLRVRPRHGRILLRGRWIHFPLRPLDVCLRVPPAFACGVAADVLRRPFGASRQREPDSFASALEAGLGNTICREFYFPYAQKLWGLPPDSLSPVQASRRVSANSLGKLARKLLTGLPGWPRNGAPPRSIFYYPAHGYGQISEAYARAAREQGARIHLNAQVQAVRVADGGARSVRYQQGGRVQELQADQVWSTIPITALVRGIEPAAPEDVLSAATGIGYRAMVLVYLVLGQDRFSDYDAHYVPGLDVPISRLSEPKHYSGTPEPRGRTVLCAELPCAPTDPVWQMDDAALGRLVCDSLASMGIPVRGAVREVVSRRVRQAYPIYRRGFEADFDRMDRWLGDLEGLLTFGRQGLFAHDNTHHALAMAYAAVRCLDGRGRVDRHRWQEARAVFATHVVED